MSDAWESVHTVGKLFGEDGVFANAFTGYQPRQSQIELAEEILRGMSEGGRLLAEAPTGVGKSVGYLTPAILRVGNAERTLVVTANIALQEQLCRKDLPTLKRVLPSDLRFEFALIKGVSNYLCRLKLDESVKRQGARALQKIIDWDEETQTGDLSEFPDFLADDDRRSVVTSSEECLGYKCPKFGVCHIKAARNQAAAAQVVVTNYHLFFADLVVRALTQQSILPDYDHLVWDEAHKAAEIARDFLGTRMTRGSMRNPVAFLRRCGQLGERESQALESTASFFFEELETFRKSELYKARLRAELPIEWGTLEGRLKVAARMLEEQTAREENPVMTERVRKAAEQSANMALTLRDTATLGKDSFVYWIDPPEGRGSAALCSGPLDVSSYLREQVFQAERIKSVACVSATLTTGGSFDLFERELGADGARKLEVPSPFDWARQALVVVPPGIPDPSDKKRFPEAMAGAVLDVARAAGGRTLGLFTSYRNLELAAKTMRAAGVPWKVLVQGEGPRTQLVDEFRRDVSSVLLGTASFWEGVDVQGEALSCVVMDKLPFESPDDPFVDALDAKRRDYFVRYAVPRAIVAFRQGIGRLIRTTTDRGVAVILDQRVYSKPYGRRFISALPNGVPVERGVDWQGRITKFLAAA